MNEYPGHEKPCAVRRRAMDNTGAWASTSGDDASGDARDTLCLALAAIDTACQQLNRYATATDAPAWQVVEAADLLDVVAACVADAVMGRLHHVDL